LAHGSGAKLRDHIRDGFSASSVPKWCRASHGEEQGVARVLVGASSGLSSYTATRIRSQELHLKDLT
jgi:hypothetical protein